MTDSDDNSNSIYYSDDNEQDIDNDIIQKYELTVWKAYNNMQYYILKKATNYDNNTMFENYFDFDTFKSIPENKKFISEINRLIKKFNIKKYEHHLEKLRDLHDGYFYATVIDMDELWDACIGLEHKYDNINVLYDNYQEVYKHFNP